MRRTAAVLVAAILLSTAALVSAGAAGATPPTTETETFSGTNVLTDLCAFDVTLDFRATFTATTFYEGAGDPVRVQTHAVFLGTLTNADTGKSVTDRDYWMTTVKLESGTSTIVGLLFHINIPGHGIVVLWAGRAVLDLETDEPLFEAGPKDVESGEKTLCAYLADP
jgi:hypothetical protein